MDRKFHSPALSRRAFLALATAAGLPGRALAEGADSGLARVAAVASPLVRELEHWVEEQGGRLSAAIADARSGAELCGVAAGDLENPASNQKLVTAAAALFYLGPSFTYETGLYGALQGRRIESLVIRGEGDPSLSSAALAAMVESLVARGVRDVGAVLVDQSAFDDRFVPPAFEQQPAEWAPFRAPVSAVAVDGNATTFCAQPTQAGQPARVWFEPAGFVEVEGEVKTVAAGRKNYPGLTVRGSKQRLLARVAGAIPEGARTVRWRKRVEDPRYYAGYVLKHLLEQRGVRVGGEVRLGGAAERKKLVAHRSAPLQELLHAVGKNSDNFYAEMILKTLGLRLMGRPGQSADGAEALVAFLKQLGAHEAGTRMVNGSGLYDANRISPRALTRVLARAFSEPRVVDPFLAQLAVGGVDGTLKSRFHALGKQRSVLAKTGTLRRVVALSGYAFGPERSRGVTFSFIVSDVTGRHGEVRRRIDEVVEAVAGELWRERSQNAAASR